MSVKIRLARHGSKKRPHYRIVVADSEAPRDGKFLEIVGTYNPLVDPVKVTIEQDRVTYWMDKGVILSDTVKSIFKKQGVFSKSA
ncbi:MAG: 30S ribosomal protein S16 [Deltaproteobacteria bacterium]|nr:30S ribosomal protein S16 [Deltaproteobacteria bacterium]MBW2218700.1 30S ribosomal protein S16 [Deltaproteobacteria bacterium]